MVILATHQREIGSNPLKRANCTFDVNGEMKFSVKIARSYWTKDMTYGNLVYIPDTEYGGIIGKVLTSTTLDYVELKAMMEFLYSTAVRVGELVKLNRGDIRFSTKDLIVCGKGDKERVVYLNERTHMYLLEYLESRTDMNPALFVSLRSPHERLTDKGVEDIVRRTGRRVGVKAYPHKFRGTSITNALNRGMPLQEASCMAGHVKSDTTLRYAQLDQDSVRYHHKKYLSA